MSEPILSVGKQEQLFVTAPYTCSPTTQKYLTGWEHTKKLLKVAEFIIEDWRVRVVVAPTKNGNRGEALHIDIPDEVFVDAPFGVLWVNVPLAQVGEAVLEWIGGRRRARRLDRKQFVLHSARFDDDMVRLVFMSAGKSAEVLRVAEVERAKARKLA